MQSIVRFCICLLLLLGTQALSAQLLLQLETMGKVKTKKFQIGETLTYRLQGSEQWEEGTIENLIYEDKLIVFNNRYTEIDQIVALRSYQPQSWSRPISYSLYSFGAAWGLFSAGAALVDKDDPYTWGDLAVTGTSMALGFAIQQLFKKRDYKIGKRRRLRILDLRVFN